MNLLDHFNTDEFFGAYDITTMIILKSTSEEEFTKERSGECISSYGFNKDARTNS
jgi:hypothetical protein